MSTYSGVFVAITADIFNYNDEICRIIQKPLILCPNSKHNYMLAIVTFLFSIKIQGYGTGALDLGICPEPDLRLKFRRNRSSV